MPCDIMSRKSQGFTLIELVAGIVVFGFAILLMTTLLFPQAKRAGSALHEVRAAELAHSLLNEINSKKFDENTPTGGVPACGSSSPGALACSDTMGPDSEGRGDYDDVDDFNGLNENSDMNSSGEKYQDYYENYRLSVSVAYANPPAKAQKIVSVTVTTPGGTELKFNSVRSNF
ncbi:type II secretion system GspH family protein [Parasalinivibrio latis]|uniref:type IV pilus modification PilV family protein n=1 Tax=Parasalinivibrio latis TaxID=2952610 RepID=UPI0030E3A3A6